MTENGTGIGTVTPEMVRDRAVELAAINGHSKPEPSQTDLEQAKRELTGEGDADPKDELLAAAPESERWDPVPGSKGHKAPESSSEDTDDDGRSDSARLVEEGMEEAEHDQMLQATKAQQQKDAS